MWSEKIKWKIRILLWKYFKWSQMVVHLPLEEAYFELNSLNIQK